MTTWLILVIFLARACSLCYSPWPLSHSKEKRNEKEGGGIDRWQAQVFERV
jgi:hypothetical protein